MDPRLWLSRARHPRLQSILGTENHLVGVTAKKGKGVGKGNESKSLGCHEISGLSGRDGTV